MINESLGLPIDIHGGGSDLIFPHHENEVAQGICSGVSSDYAKVWLHNGMLNMQETKMSKSHGETLTAHALLDDYPGEVIRWALLTAHYRAPLDWQKALLDQSKRSLDRLYGALWRSLHIKPENTEPCQQFLDALSDNLNTPRAFAELFSIASRLESGDAGTQAVAKGQLLSSAQMMGFLSINPTDWFHRGVESSRQAEIAMLLEARVEARAKKDWKKADSIRDELVRLKVEVMDSAEGARWRVLPD